MIVPTNEVSLSSVIPTLSIPSDQDALTSSSKGNFWEKIDDTHSTPQTTSSTTSRPRQNSTQTPGQDGDDAAWGSNFWVTLVDPQTQTSFFACPATGQVSWDPPVGSFVLPPSEAGEWWELCDDSRGGLSYYYQTKTGETVWERPEGFVIPLGIIQNTALGRRLSHRFSRSLEPGSPTETPTAKHPRSHYINNPDTGQMQSAQSSRSGSATKKSTIQRSNSSDPRISTTTARPGRSHVLGQQLTPIPSSEASAPPSPSLNPITLSPTPTDEDKLQDKNNKNSQTHFRGTLDISTTPPRLRAKSSSYAAHRPQQPQSLNAAAEQIITSHSDSGHDSSQKSPTSISTGSNSLQSHRSLTLMIEPTIQTNGKIKHNAPPSPRRPIPAIPNGSDSTTKRSTPAPMVAGRSISGPIPNRVATFEMSPVKNRADGRPIPVQPRIHLPAQDTPIAGSLTSRNYPTLPVDLATDIQQFSESDFARQYFSTHRTGFIFRRKVPVTQMMTWQKPPLSSPLLALNRSLNKDAVKIFKVIQHIMGDRERWATIGRPPQPEDHISTVMPINSSMTSLAGNMTGILEEERWLLGEGLTHGELRDEIYCQLMKQLTGNPNTESAFKGWQLLCVLLITFPPSKNFETYLSSFIQQHTSRQEGRVDVIAKYCLRRLAYISNKGPRGKPPTIAEIETASDAAFHPSTFGESLDAIIRLQERKYPQQKVPIILPFLADGILALGGLKSEGIFRVPGDSDSVSELKLRIDRGYYTTDGVNNPHVLASLLKLWLRELCDPLVPEEMYNECITRSKDADACVRIVERLPTINRRVVLFVISFLQLFLEDRAQSITKMTPANLALVMAPNLLRCNSDSMAVVFTNAQYEQIFVYNLLLHLQCSDVDADYIPIHGLGATPSAAPSKIPKSRSRHPHHG